MSSLDKDLVFCFGVENIKNIRNEFLLRLNYKSSYKRGKFDDNGIFDDQPQGIELV